MSKWRLPGVAWAALGFVALSLFINRELLPVFSNALPGNLGDPMLNAWILAWVSNAAASAPLDVWQAPIFHPHADSLAYSESLMGIAAFVAPVYWITGNAFVTYNVAFIAGYAFAGFAMFMLVRDLTGRWDAAAVAGMLFACSPYLVSSHATRIQMLTSGWSVLALMYLHRYVRSAKTRPLLAFTGCWIAQSLSNTYLGVYLAMPVAVVLVHAALVRRPTLRLRQYAQLAAAGLGIVACLAPLLAVYARVQSAMGFTYDLNYLRRYSADVTSYFSIWTDYAPQWLRPENTADLALFPGAVLLTFALVGAVAVLVKRDRPLTVADAVGPGLYAVIGVTALMLSLGPDPTAFGHSLGVWSPYQFLLDVVPGFDGLRAPARFALHVLLAAAVFAGFGMAVLLRGRSSGIRIAAVVVFAAAAVTEARRPYHWVFEVPAAPASVTAAYEWLAAQPPAAMLELPVVRHFQDQRAALAGSATHRYQLATLQHGHALVNGTSGFASPLVTMLQSPSSPLATHDTSTEALRIVRALGTKYVVVHLHEYRNRYREHAEGMLAAMRADAAQVESVQDFGDTVVLTLVPGLPSVAPPPAQVMSPTLYSVTASHDIDEVPHLSDGMLSTRWIAPQYGESWLEVQLGRTRSISGIKLVRPPYAVAESSRRIRVVGTDSSGMSHVLFEGSTAFAAAMTSVHEPAEPGLRLTWPAIPLSRLRIEQLGNAGDLRWAVFELHVHTGTDGDAGN